MTNEVTRYNSKERELVDSDSKASWVGAIANKFVQNKPLTTDEVSFMQNMMANSNSKDYGAFIKNFMLAIPSHPEFHHDEVVVENMFKWAQININMYKAEKQGHRDDAITRKMDVDTINKYSKLAKDKGATFDAEKYFDLPSAKTYTTDKTVDTTIERSEDSAGDGPSGEKE